MGCEQSRCDQVSSSTNGVRWGIRACRRASTTQIQITSLVCALKGALWPRTPGLINKDSHFQKESFPSRRTRVQETCTSLRFPRSLPGLSRRVAAPGTCAAPRDACVVPGRVPPVFAGGPEARNRGVAGARWAGPEPACWAAGEGLASDIAGFWLSF